MKNQYDVLLERILDPSTPDPTIVVHNEAHLSNLRAGLSRAKYRIEAYREFMGLTSLLGYEFSYVQSPSDPYKYTIRLEKKKPSFTIEYATAEPIPLAVVPTSPPTGEQNVKSEVLLHMGGTKGM